jgi:hypothetical protein
MMRSIIIVSCLCLGLWSLNGLAAEEMTLQQTIDKAKSTLNKAIAVQGGWMSTKKLITSAELSAAKGDKKKARQLAEKAQREAELSYQQALNQTTHWSEPDYLK